MRRKKWEPGPLLIVAGIGAAVFVGLFILAALGFGAGNSARKGTEKHWTRTEARSNLIGKTQQQVKDAIGKPDHTYEFSRGRQLWSYNSVRVVWDSAAEKYIAFGVEFDGDGVCTDVR